MFSYETEHIIRKIQNRVLGSRDSVSLRLILSAPIHDAIKVYFRASIADKHGHPKRFHTEQSADIDTLKSEIDLLLPSNFTFNKDTFTSLLTDAVHFQFNYLCRPRWTMKEFFFHNSALLTIPELKQRFLYFSAYDYYPKVLFRYLQKKNIKQVDRSAFDEIVQKIDKLVLGEATPDDYVKLLQPFADFISYGREDNDASIPEHALALFFGDKGFNHIRNYLESTLQEQNIEMVTIEELHQLLSMMPKEGLDIREEPSIPTAPPLQEEPETEMPVDDAIEEEATPDEEPAEEETPIEELEPPLEEETLDLESDIENLEFENREIAEENDDIIEEENEIPAVEVDEPPIVEESFKEEPEQESESMEETEKYDDSELFRPIQPDTEGSDEYADEPQEQEEEEKPEHDTAHEEAPPVDMYDEPEGETIIEEEFIDEEFQHDEESTEEEEKPRRFSSTMPPLELLIEDDERKRFIRKLFNGDTAYFNVVIETLNKLTSWKEASLYIDEIFLMNGVDPYSTDSVNFTDKVYTRFSHKSKYK